MVDHFTVTFRHFTPMSGLLGAAKKTNEEFFIFGRKVEHLGRLLYHVHNRTAVFRFMLLLVRDPLDSLSNILTLGRYTHGFFLRGK
jgi:hypothetical protein